MRESSSLNELYWNLWLARDGNCLASWLAVLIYTVIDTIKRFRVLYDDVKPDVGLDLAGDMGVCAGRNALNWSLNF